MTVAYQQTLADRGAYAKFLISPYWRETTFYAKGEHLLEHLYTLAQEDIKTNRSRDYVSPVYRESCHEAIVTPIPQIDPNDLYGDLFKTYFSSDSDGEAPPDYSFSEKIQEQIAAINQQLQNEVPQLYTEGEMVEGKFLEEMFQTYIDTKHPIREVSRPLWSSGAVADPTAVTLPRTLNPLHSSHSQIDHCVGYPWMITLDFDKAQQQYGFRWADMKTFQLSLREQETGKLITGLPSIPMDFAEACGETLDHAVRMCRNAGPNGSVWDRIYLWADEVQQVLQMMDVAIDAENRAFLDAKMLLQKVTEKHFGRKAEKRTA